MPEVLCSTNIKRAELRQPQKRLLFKFLHNLASTEEFVVRSGTLGEDEAGESVAE